MSSSAPDVADIIWQIGLPLESICLFAILQFYSKDGILIPNSQALDFKA